MQLKDFSVVLSLKMNQIRPNYFWAILSKNDHCLPGNHKANHLTSKKKEKKREVLSFFLRFTMIKVPKIVEIFNKNYQNFDFCAKNMSANSKEIGELVQLIFYLQLNT